MEHTTNSMPTIGVLARRLPDAERIVVVDEWCRTIDKMLAKDARHNPTVIDYVVCSADGVTTVAIL